METVRMSQRELRKVQVLTLVLGGQLAPQDAAERLGLSRRQVRRLLRKLEQGGAAALAHGNRGRASPRRLDVALRERILELAEGRYADCNDTHFAELLAEREGIVVGRETLRALLRSSGRRPKRKRRPKRHRRRRPRSAAKGLMVLWDGSPHRWLGDSGETWTLMAAVDDADGELLAALFTPAETSAAYLQLLDQIVHRHGIPQSIYQDRHSALRRNDEHWTLEEQLAGRQRPTQVGQALEDLGIHPLFALSPQAKGRIERLFGVTQDRLLVEMALEDLSTIQEANVFLQSWIPRYNQRFQRTPEDSEPAFGSTQGLDLHKILAFRYQATVGNDNAVRLGGRTFDIPPAAWRQSFAQAKVDVRQHLDGTWSICYQDRLIAQADPSSLAEPLRVRRHSARSKTKAATQDMLLYLPTKPQLERTFSLGT